jgi:hypothetical protein
MRQSGIAASVCWGDGPNEMRGLFERHRQAESARDYDGILDTFVEDCFLDTKPWAFAAMVGRRFAVATRRGTLPRFRISCQGRREAFGDDVMVVWGFVRGTSGGEWMEFLLPAARSLSRLRTSRRSATG